MREGTEGRGATFVIVTHRPRLLTIADSILLLRDGAQVAFRNSVGYAAARRHERGTANAACAIVNGPVTGPSKIIGDRGH